jgi:hypothetical protein
MRLHFIDNLNDITCPIGRHTSIHATNGTYAYDAHMIVPTTLAGFQFIAENDRLSKKHHMFLIGVNSDESMKRIGIEVKEDQMKRAWKVAGPLALQHPTRDIAVAFYDEETPEELYRTLKHDVGADLISLHKWGYGTAPDAPKIIGSDNFDFTLGFPLPNDKKPVCYGVTPVEDQPHVNVFRLTEPVCGKGPYMSEQGKILFPVVDPLLNIYTQAGFDEHRARNAVGTPPTPEQP